MNRLRVIGAGPGAAELLTAAAAEAIAGADAVWCAERHSALVPPGKRRALLPFGAAIGEMETALREGLACAVLLSGDPGLYSLLPRLRERFGENGLSVLPGVSSAQALCAALGTGWEDAKILSAHGRALSPSALCHFARTCPKTLVLLDGEKNPRWVRTALDGGGLEELPLVVGERLSCEGESVAPYEERDYDPLSVAFIANGAPEPGLPPAGIPDGEFIRGKTPMTKREIRRQILGELRLKPDAVVWDIGAGTGSVSVECARQCPLGTVFAVEREEEALSLIRRNRERFFAQNLVAVPGEAPEALSGLPLPTHAFLGGTGGRAREILDYLSGLGARIRLVATAATVESAAFYTETLSGFGDFTAAQIAVSRLLPAGSVHLLRAENPVFVFSATLEGKP